MNSRKLILIAALFLLPLCLMANRTSVEIIAPSSADEGEEITVKIEVSHRGNSSRHHTDWVYLKINGEEVKRWEFSRNDLPEDSDFVLEYVFEVTKTVELEAKGNCNIHGSSGEETKTITVD